MDIKNNYIELGIDLKSKPGTTSFDFLLENKHELQRLFENEEFVINTLKGDVLDKWFIYRSLDFVESISLGTIHSIINSSMGINNQHCLLDSMFKNLVRLSSYYEVVDFIIYSAKLYQSTLSKYFYIQLLKLVEIPDLITYDTKKVIIDRRGTYKWNGKSYSLQYSKTDKEELKAYELHVNNAIVKKYKFVLNAYIKYRDIIEIQEVCRYMFPREENCPVQLIELYKKCYNI